MNFSEFYALFKMRNVLYKFAITQLTFLQILCKGRVKL